MSLLARLTAAGGRPRPPAARHVRAELERACAGRVGRWPCTLAEGHRGACRPPIAETELDAWRRAIAG